jgi:uncharacterized membrane protein
MTPSPTPLYGPEPGRSAAFVVYVLYLMSIPSVGVLALVGVVVAYIARDDAVGWARSHIENQIAAWWTAVWWNICFAALFIVGVILSIVLIGIPLIWLACLGWFIVMIWFTVKSVFGLIALLDGRPG